MFTAPLLLGFKVQGLRFISFSDFSGFSTSHRDRGGWGRDPRNFRRFWTLDPLRVSGVSTVTGIVGVGVAILVIVVAFGLSIL